MGIFSRLRKRTVSLRRRIRKVVKAPIRRVRRRIVSRRRTVRRPIRKVRKSRRPPIRKTLTRIRTAVSRIARRRKPTLPRPRIISRSAATRRIQPVRTPKRINKKSISIFDKLRSVTGNAFLKIRKTRAARPNRITSISSFLKKLKIGQPKTIRFNLRRKEDVKVKKSIFSRIKSISRSLATKVKQNYILPVGFGAAKNKSVRSDIFKRFFGGFDKDKVNKLKNLIKSPFKVAGGLAGFGIGVGSKAKSSIGNWFADRKEDLAGFKKKGLFDTVKDFFKGEGAAEEERKQLLEEEEMQELGQEKKKKLFRNIAIGGSVGLLALFLLRRRKNK